MKITRRQLHYIIREAVKEKDMIDEEPETMLVADPSNPDTEFAIGIKEKIITVFRLVKGEEAKEITSDDPDFNRILVLINKSVESQGDSTSKKEWKNYLQQLFPNIPFKNLRHRLKVLSKEFV